jgi:hypothetical protein
MGYPLQPSKVYSLRQLPFYRWTPAQLPPSAADTGRVKLRATDLDRIVEAFAKAWADGDLEAACGWANAAEHAARCEEDRRGRRVGGAEGSLHIR